jgi:hypothetical protein
MKRIIPDNSRWLKIVPELTFFHDPAERGAAWYRAFRTFRWRYVAMASLMTILVLALATPVYNYLMSHLRELLWAPRLRSAPDAMLQFMFTSLLGVSGASLLIRFYRRNIQRSLRSQLIERGTPICLECGYDLRGQIESRCPECGTAFDSSLLQPRSAHQREQPPAT